MKKESPFPERGMESAKTAAILSLQETCLQGSEFSELFPKEPITQRIQPFLQCQGSPVRDVWC